MKAKKKRFSAPTLGPLTYLLVQLLLWGGGGAVNNTLKRALSAAADTSLLILIKNTEVMTSQKTFFAFQHFEYHR